METAEFLKATITGGAGHFVMAYRNHVDPWAQEWYTWPMDLNKIVERASAMKATHDVYFTSYLFTDRTATRMAALPTSTIQADLDRADISSLPVTPSILVETSPKHYHAYWLLNQQLSKLDHERLSKRMTYSIPDADHTGWAIGHRLRVANTLNHKYLNPDGSVHTYDVRVLFAPMHKYAAEDIELLPDVAPEIEALTDEDAEHDPFLAAAVQGKIDVGIGHLQLLESIKDRIPISVYIAEAQALAPQPDRSAALWSLMCSCFNAGLSREAVYWLAYNSPNNKFKQDQRYHAELDLALDVQRAERHVKQATFDARAMIDVLRQHKGKRYATHRGIASVVRDVMHTEGEFIKTFAGDVWYLPNSTGKPMEVSTRDHGLNALLELRYGLNPTELEQSYVVENLITNTASLPETANTAILSYYDLNNNAVLLHTGHRNIMKVSAEGVTHQKNGGNNVLFTWESIFETFSPALAASPLQGQSATLDWGKELFGPLDTITNMAPEEARSILKVWFMFLLFRNAAESRPILAFFGSPGCLSGKTPIKVKRGTHKAREYLLEELYGVLHQTTLRLGRPIDRRLCTEVLCLHDGVISYKPIHDIVQSGVKQTYTISIDKRILLRPTADHKFLTPNGYVPLSELHAGDTVILDGGLTRKEPDAKRTSFNYYRETAARYHPRAYHHIINGQDYPRMPYANAVIEAAMNNMPTEAFIALLNSSPFMIQHLKFLPKGTNIHHKDEDTANNALDNLEVIEHDDHTRLHAAQRKLGYSRPRTATVDWIVKNNKPEMTYDIIMEDAEHPNFVANEVVVHNSGKTSIMRRIYRLLYAKRLAVSGLTSAEDYDHSSAKVPFYCIDNADSYTAWLPDKLAQSIGDIDTLRRKLYSNGQIVRMRKQALVGVTAHAPKFTVNRPDVADRLLLMNFKRVEEDRFMAEGLVYWRIDSLRDQLWGAIVHDLQAILQQGSPKPQVQTSMRVQDFAWLGEWIASGLDTTGQHLDVFRKAIGNTLLSQSSLILQDDEALITSLSMYVQATGGTHGQYITSTELYQRVLDNCTETHRFQFQKAVRSSKVFGSKIFNMYHILSNLFDITYEDGMVIRTWNIAPKPPPQP